MPAIADPDYIKELRQWLLANKSLYESFHEYGTGGGMESGMTSGNLPVRNFRDGNFPEVTRISGETLKDTIRVRMESCYACSVRCKKVVKVEEPYQVDPAYGGPEYETLAALGSNCGISDLKAIARGNQLCNAYSLDTISTGVTISFAMECFENGLLSIEDTNGIELKFGNAEAMLKIIELIARREGIGNLLAEGSARATKKIGGSQDFAMQVKGLEIPMHEPRVKAGLGLGYEVNPHGADHCANMHDNMYNTAARVDSRVKSLGIEPLPADELGPRKAAQFRSVHLSRVALDCLLLCFFVPYDTDQMVKTLSAVTGWKISLNEVLRVAERTMTLGRLFNIREGFTVADDKLPKRFFQPKTSGVLANKHYSAEELEKTRHYYYTLMGWDKNTGIPLPEKLEELGIQ
ncbi:MAG: aldehyde ferredoxin oxidoreductase C-terminal domain-containing protein [Chloroflexi bacterium]|nr:aldehyde ferredoxin oxidoreductase C-terminal domain-containing protein [Chloroflexota bacterium]